MLFFDQIAEILTTKNEEFTQQQKDLIDNIEKIRKEYAEKYNFDIFNPIIELVTLFDILERKKENNT